MIAVASVLAFCVLLFLIRVAKSIAHLPRFVDEKDYPTGFPYSESRRRDPKPWPDEKLPWVEEPVPSSGRPPYSTTVLTHGRKSTTLGAVLEDDELEEMLASLPRLPNRAVVPPPVGGSRHRSQPPPPRPFPPTAVSRQRSTPSPVVRAAPQESVSPWGQRVRPTSESVMNPGPRALRPATTRKVK